MNLNPFANPFRTTDSAAPVQEQQPAAPEQAQGSTQPPAEGTQTPPAPPAAPAAPEATASAPATVLTVDPVPPVLPIAPAVEPEPVVQGPVYCTVTVPRDYRLTGDDHVVHPYKAGVQEMLVEHADHWYSKANGVTKYVPNKPE